MAYTFDGDNKRIILSNGTTELDVQDMYSRWIDWVATSDNSKYLPAITYSGGEQIGISAYASFIFFLLNDWKIRPYEGDHTLTINGNLYADDFSSPFVVTLGGYNVIIQSYVNSIYVPTIIDLINTLNRKIDDTQALILVG